MIKRLFVGAIALALVAGCTSEKPVATTPSDEATPLTPEELHQQFLELKRKSDELNAEIEQYKRDGDRYEKMGGLCLVNYKTPIAKPNSDCLSWLRDPTNGGYYQVKHRSCIEKPKNSLPDELCPQWLVSTEPGGYKDPENQAN